MSLINTFEEVRKYIRVSGTGNADAIPNSTRVERKFIVPIVGRELYDDVVTKYNEGNTTAPHTRLLQKMQAAIVPLAYWMDLAKINTLISDAGLKKTTTDQSVPVFRHDFNTLKSALAEQGMDELEELIIFLEENSADYPLWLSSEAYKQFRKFIIKTGREFDQVYKLYHPRRCYLAFLPVMQWVEDFYIVPIFGEEFLTHLKGVAAPSVPEKKVLELAAKAIGPLTVHHATSTLNVRITDSGFTVQLSDPDAAEPNRTEAGMPSLEQLRQTTNRMGQSYLNLLTNFLNETASSTVFTLYYNSPLYQKPGQIQTPLNADLRSSFEML